MPKANKKDKARYASRRGRIAGQNVTSASVKPSAKRHQDQKTFPLFTQKKKNKRTHNEKIFARFTDDNIQPWAPTVSPVQCPTKDCPVLSRGREINRLDAFFHDYTSTTLNPRAPGFGRRLFFILRLGQSTKPPRARTRAFGQRVLSACGCAGSPTESRDDLGE